MKPNSKQPTLQQSIAETLLRMRHILQDEAANLRASDVLVVSGNRDRIRLLELSASETDRALTELERRTEVAKRASNLGSKQATGRESSAPIAKLS